MKSHWLTRIPLCLALAATFAAAPCAEARLGETLGQCVQRYGQPVTKIDGRGAVFGVAVFYKDGIVVTTVFGKQTRKCVAVLYTHGDYATADQRQKMTSLGSGQITSLEGTIAGRWEQLDMGATDAKPNRSATAAEIAMRNAVERAMKAKGALERLMIAMSTENPRYDQGRFTYDAMSFLNDKDAYSEGDFSIRPSKHMGRNVFSFGLFALDIGAMSRTPHHNRYTLRNGRRVPNIEGIDELCYGFAIVDSDSAQAIESWASSQLAAIQGKVPRDQSQQTLQGF